MKQDSLGQDGNDGLSVRVLQEVIQGEKGSVCRIFTYLPVAAKPCPVDDLHLLKHKLWLPASQHLGFLMASLSADAAGSGQNFLRCTLGLDRRSGS